MLIDKGCGTSSIPQVNASSSSAIKKNIVGCYFDFFYGLRRVGEPFHWDFTVCVHELIAVRLQSLCCAVRARAKLDCVNAVIAAVDCLCATAAGKACACCFGWSVVLVARFDSFSSIKSAL